MGQRLPKTTHGSPDRPLKIGQAEIPCFVLEGGRRVITQRGLIEALQLVRGDKREPLQELFQAEAIQPFATPALVQLVGAPIRFRVLNGPIECGYEATILADICAAVLAARRERSLSPEQLLIAGRCEILLSGYARTGIIALVDEVTGYQADRKREELQRILDAYISPELRKWTKTFPDEYYKEMFRLLNWPWDATKVAKPGVVGHLTNLVIYERLPDGVLSRLRELEPVNPETGRRANKFHQHLSEDFGARELQHRLIAILPMMRASRTWKGFVRSVMDAWPKPNDQLALFDPNTWEPPEA